MTSEEIEEIASTPAGFGRAVLGLDMYPKQEDIVNEFNDLHSRVKVSVAAPNGSGKSSVIIPTLALRNLATKPQGRVIITSKDSRQLDEQVWPALESHRGKFGNLEWYQRYVLSKEGGCIIGFTTDDPARAEGWHAKIEPPSARQSGDDHLRRGQVDSGSDLRGILRAVHVQRSPLHPSSTGEMSGAFYRSQMAGSDFSRYQITYEDCKHVLDEKRVESLRSFYPPDDPFLRSTLYAEFMDHSGEAGKFTSLAIIRKWIENPPEEKTGDTVAFCDFAGGGSENVLAIRRGNRVRLVKCWREVNEMVAIGEFIALFREHHLKPHEIYGDNAGAGKPMIARFGELGWEINRFNGSSPAMRESDFTDRNAEVWYTGGREVGKGKLILPDDPTLHDQMCGRKRGADAKGRIRAESKEAMANRGLKSPDRADAVMAVIAIRPLLFKSKFDDMFGDPTENDLLDEGGFGKSELEKHNILGAEAGV